MKKGEEDPKQVHTVLWGGGGRTYSGAAGKGAGGTNLN